MSQELFAILDEAGVTARFKEFCAKNNVLTATDLGVSCSREDLLNDEILDASKFTDLSFPKKTYTKSLVVMSYPYGVWHYSIGFYPDAGCSQENA